MQAVQGANWQWGFAKGRKKHREGNIDADWWANNPEQRVKLHVSAAQFARYDNYLLRFDGSCSRTAAGCAAVLYGAMGSCTNDSDLELFYIPPAGIYQRAQRSKQSSQLALPGCILCCMRHVAGSVGIVRTIRVQRPAAKDGEMLLRVLPYGTPSRPCGFAVTAA